VTLAVFQSALDIVLRQREETNQFSTHMIAFHDPIKVNSEQWICWLLPDNDHHHVHDFAYYRFESIIRPVPV